MLGLTINLKGDGAAADVPRDKLIHVAGRKPIQVIVLDGGMASGRPSVALRIDLPDGQVVIAETSARLFCSAGRAIAAAHPKLFDDN